MYQKLFKFKTDQKNEGICYILQHHFEKGDNASQACEKTWGVYGEGVVSKSAALKWFARFRCGNFNVKDEYCSGRTITKMTGY